MSKRSQPKLKKDRDGNIILKEPILKKYTAIMLLILSAALLIGSLYLLIKGVFTVVNFVRIAGAVIVLVYAVWMLKSRTVYIITKEKILAFGLWEVFLKDIDTITLNKLKFIKILTITDGISEYTIEQSTVNVPLEYIAEYLTKKLKKK